MVSKIKIENIFNTIISVSYVDWRIIFLSLTLQFGFLLIALIWKFDFAPFMVLIIAILNDGKALPKMAHALIFFTILRIQN